MMVQHDPKRLRRLAGSLTPITCQRDRSSPLFFSSLAVGRASRKRRRRKGAVVKTPNKLRRVSTTAPRMSLCHSRDSSSLRRVSSSPRAVETQTRSSKDGHDRPLYIFFRSVYHTRLERASAQRRQGIMPSKANERASETETHGIRRNDLLLNSKHILDSSLPNTLLPRA